MRPRQPARYGAAALILALAAFALGMAGLFRDRFEAGDIYPAYSTLRSDPMGCRALFAALGNLEGARVGRALSQEDFREGRGSTAYFFLGQEAGWGELNPFHAKDLDSLARAGGRVVVSWIPTEEYSNPLANLERYRDSLEADSLRARSKRDSSTSATAKDTSAKVDSSGGKPDSTQTARRKSKSGKAGSGEAKAKKDPMASKLLWSSGSWRYRLALDTSSGDSAALEALGAAGDSVAWITDRYFDSLGADWKVHYRRDGRPVVVERALGKGSVVLLADTYWASNEALFHSRPGHLLSLLLGDRSVILFDERHLGIGQDKSLANLLMKYRLHYLLPSLLLLFALYLWRSRAGTVTAATTATPDAEAGAPAGERGMRGLLSRYIPADQLLQACLAQWKETEGRNSPVVRRAGEEADAIAAASAARPKQLVEDYRKIQALINRRKTQ